MSEHAVLELVNSILGIIIKYFSKVLDTLSYCIVHHAIVLNKLNQGYKKINTMTGSKLKQSKISLAKSTLV